jgi:hypothetical protein
VKANHLPNRSCSFELKKLQKVTKLKFEKSTQSFLQIIPQLFLNYRNYINHNFILFSVIKIARHFIKNKFMKL